MSEHARWQGRYSTPDYLFGKAPNYFLAARKPLLPKSGKALAVADGEADALGGTGPNITRCQNPWNCGLKRTGLAIGEWPATGLYCIDARQYIT